MSRIQVPITVIDLEGNAVAGAAVTVKNRADGSPAQVFANESTPTPEGSNTVTTDAFGRVNYWVPTGLRYIASVSGSGIANYDEAFDAPAAVPSAVSKPNGFSLGGLVLVPANNTTDIGVAPGFFVRPAPNEKVYIASMDYKMHAGQITFKVQRNGVDIDWGGGATLTAGTGGGSKVLATPIECVAGDYIQLIVLTNPTNSGYSFAGTLTTHHYPAE